MNWQGFPQGSLGPCNLDAPILASGIWHLQQSRAPPRRLIPFAHSSDVSIESPKNPQIPSLKALIPLALLTRRRFGRRMQEQQTARRAPGLASLADLVIGPPCPPLPIECANAKTTTRFNSTPHHSLEPATTAPLDI